MLAEYELNRNPNPSSNLRTVVTSVNAFSRLLCLTPLSCYSIVFSVFLAIYACAFPVIESKQIDLEVRQNPKRNISTPLTSAFSSTLTKRNLIQGKRLRSFWGQLIQPLKKPSKLSHQKRGAGAMANTYKAPQRLFTKLGGFYVEITRKGKVKGTRRRNAYSALQFISISRGVVAIKALRTRRFLAMDRRGRLVGLRAYNSRMCNFHEIIIENNHFVFYQEYQTKLKRKTVIQQKYMGFNRRGKPVKKRKLQQNDSATHFQKLRYRKPRRRRPKIPRRPVHRKRLNVGKRRPIKTTAKGR